MGYVTIYVETPDKQKYEADVDLEFSPEELLEGLRTFLNLPETDDKGRPIEYELLTVGKQLVPGGTVRIQKKPSPAVRGVRHAMPSISKTDGS